VKLAVFGVVGSVLLSSGCFFLHGAVGVGATPGNPPPPTGDYLQLRGGAGAGVGNKIGSIQVSGDALLVGGIGAAGVAVQGALFVYRLKIYSTEHNPTNGGIAVVARSFAGTGIGRSTSTQEFSLGLGLALNGVDEVRNVHWVKDGTLLFTAFRTTFEDREPIWTLGGALSVTVGMDP